VTQGPGGGILPQPLKGSCFFPPFRYMRAGERGAALDLLAGRTSSPGISIYCSPLHRMSEKILPVGDEGGTSPPPPGAATDAPPKETPPAAPPESQSEAAAKDGKDAGDQPSPPQADPPKDAPTADDPSAVKETPPEGAGDKLEAPRQDATSDAKGEQDSKKDAVEGTDGEHRAETGEARKKQDEDTAKGDNAGAETKDKPGEPGDQQKGAGEVSEIMRLSCIHSD
jgi:hypothetical protein